MTRQLVCLSTLLLLVGCGQRPASTPAEEAPASGATRGAPREIRVTPDGAEEVGARHRAGGAADRHGRRHAAGHHRPQPAAHRADHVADRGPRDVDRRRCRRPGPRGTGARGDPLARPGPGADHVPPGQRPTGGGRPRTRSRAGTAQGRGDPAEGGPERGRPSSTRRRPSTASPSRSCTRSAGTIPSSTPSSRRRREPGTDLSDLVDPTLTLRAPIDGRVVTRDVVAGEHVHPDKLLFTVSDLSTVWALLDAREKDLPGLTVGGRVAVTSEVYGARRFEGRLTSDRRRGGREAQDDQAPRGAAEPGAAAQAEHVRAGRAGVARRDARGPRRARGCGPDHPGRAGRVRARHPMADSRSSRW